MRVDVHIVLPTGCFYRYHREPEAEARIAEECNGEVAEMVKDHPERFFGRGRCYAVRVFN